MGDEPGFNDGGRTTLGQNHDLVVSSGPNSFTTEFLSLSASKWCIIIYGSGPNTEELFLRTFFYVPTARLKNLITAINVYVLFFPYQPSPTHLVDYSG